MSKICVFKQTAYFLNKQWSRQTKSGQLGVKRQIDQSCGYSEGVAQLRNMPGDKNAFKQRTLPGLERRGA